MNIGHEHWTERCYGEQYHPSGHKEELGCKLPRGWNKQADGPGDEHGDRKLRSQARLGGESRRTAGINHGGCVGEREKLFRNGDIRDVVQPRVDLQHCACVLSACIAIASVENRPGGERG